MLYFIVISVSFEVKYFCLSRGFSPPVVLLICFQLLMNVMTLNTIQPIVCCRKSQVCSPCERRQKQIQTLPPKLAVAPPSYIVLVLFTVFILNYFHICAVSGARGLMGKSKRSCDSYVQVERTIDIIPHMM